MSSIQEQIQEIEDEIRKTQYNKATSHHIGRLKAKIARLRDEVEKKASSKGGGEGYSVRKSGDGTVGVAKKLLVETGLSDGDEIEILRVLPLEGLPEVLLEHGTRIITEGAERLRPFSPVKLIPAQSAAGATPQPDAAAGKAKKAGDK